MWWMLTEFQHFETQYLKQLFNCFLQSDCGHACITLLFLRLHSLCCMEGVIHHQRALYLYMCDPTVCLKVDVKLLWEQWLNQCCVSHEKTLCSISGASLYLICSPLHFMPKLHCGKRQWRHPFSLIFINPKHKYANEWLRLKCNHWEGLNREGWGAMVWGCSRHHFLHFFWPSGEMNEQACVCMSRWQVPLPYSTSGQVIKSRAPLLPGLLWLRVQTEGHFTHHDYTAKVLKPIINYEMELRVAPKWKGLVCSDV